MDGSSIIISVMSMSKNLRPKTSGTDVNPFLDLGAASGYFLTVWQSTGEHMKNRITLAVILPAVLLLGACAGGNDRSQAGAVIANKQGMLSQRCNICRIV
jgi:hypothetical protein